MGGDTGGPAHRTDSDGDLNVFNVDHDDNGRWLNSNYGKPDNVWNADNRWVFLRSNPFHFSPVVRFGEFCFTSCPFHPPSIRPTSSIFSDKAMYFLLSRDFVSHSTSRRIFAVSSFLIANFTYGSFSVWQVKLATQMDSMQSMNRPSIRRPSVKRCDFGIVR